MDDQIEILPGTSRLFESDAQAASSHLKRHGNIVLSPQPTDSPNDPLNWGLPRKYLHAILLFFITGFTAATANDAGSAQDGMNEEFGISYGAMNTGAGVLFVGIGYWTFLISPAAALYGRRIPYLIGITWGLIGALWFAHVKGANDSIWNQLFVGASESAAEANVQLSLSEISFEHQRGSVIGIYVLATSVGTYLGPLIGGFVSDRLGWRWIAWLSVIISSCTILVLYFCLEETMFDRAAHRGPMIDGVQDSTLANDPSSDNEKIGTSGDVKKSTSNPSSNAPRGKDEKPKTYRQRIQLITLAPNIKGTGFKQYISRLFHTLRIFGFPAVIYSGIQWGAQDAWLTFYLTLEEDNWYGPPWNYNDAQVGIMNVPCLIGAVIGCFWGGYLSDRFVFWMAKRRNGIREAEDRLWMMFPCAICSPAGMLVFGLGTAYGWNWPAPYVGLGLIGFGWGCAGDLSMAYLMDAYPEMVLEGMVGVSVINNTIGCIFTFTASTWLDNSGVRDCFIAISVLDFFFIMLTIPMMIYGKACRRWTLTRYRDFVKIRDSI
ncbi:serine/threonine kinase 16 [Leptodontidium sp. 2 PMI_412]|nr:major facilitator superfamily domain-containing protein [Leptodontidium sp. MPI-SDFR-AT-0119]KAH9224983.1 serine/threonine kinase 16 [Leptodontidium sp. 2 PMI_412]